MPQETPDLRNLREPVRFRRALTLLLMTLVLPGSAQIVAGSRKTGRWVWRVVAGLIAIVIFFVVLGLIWRSGTINILARPGTLRIVQVLLILLAVGWAALFVDAYRLGQPLTLERNHRLMTSIMDGVLIFVVVGALIYASVIVNTQRDFVASVFGNGQKSKADKGRYNVLLMGGDSGADRIGTRPDSMTVASIDADTGRTVLIGLPRNLSKVPFPAGTAMAKQFPEGFKWKNCGAECLLNAVYTYAADHKNLFPGDANPGETATMQAVEAVTGLKLNYYVLIDLAGFRDLLNAVGGITLDIGKRVPIGGGSSPIKGYIEAGKNQHLDGYHALWFARSRAESSDYERMARQKCVMSAMLNQLSPQTVLTKFQGIASASKQVVKTNIPAGELGTFTDLALDAKKLPVSSFSAVPPLIHTGDPDFALIRTKVAETIAKSESLDKDGSGGDGKTSSTPRSSTSTAPTTSTTKKPSTKKPTTSPTTPAAGVDDVASICKA
ncbi:MULTISPECIES: LCP family protein [Kribbella]|jgi:LCP family protein required for cell wall assembly|uniref:LytR family transcriptional attenuator n=1 Tax=Kribbella pratensis TaxID=2512112 RepID=A0ABY2FS19_9ACTN|nr:MULTISPECIES: LCP family protein [Kribbella]TDW95579.1 LytR family transcriptional attenuator [Kribbella pratensis]TDW98977.1 LytR family transcriptional attenuator [Kribbella sp. VKM Ac-2566]